MEKSEIVIGGAKIIHNSAIFDIQNLTSRVILDQAKFLIENCCISSDLISHLCSGVSQTELYLNKILNKALNSVKEITYTESVLSELKTMTKDKLEFFQTSEDFIETLNILLSLNPTCLTVKMEKKDKIVSAIAFDNLIILYIKSEEELKV
mmetsp:Transcript_31508/g.27896  ORF Transcript_31508/g.27896 Transcript_31508/m.27896 type:complete len:151 (-) Transcript_31508:178-630(-)